MGLSNKAINKFAKFTSSIPPAYKYKTAVLTVSKKQELVNKIRAAKGLTSDKSGS